MCVVPRCVITKDFWLSEGGKCFRQDLKFLCFYFRVKKNQNLLDIQEQCIRKLGKIQSEQ